MMVCWPAWIRTVRQRRVVRTNRLMLQPVWCSIQWVTARAAKTTLRSASVDSRRSSDRPNRTCPEFGSLCYLTFIKI